MIRARNLLFMAAACVALAACGNKAPSGQVVATVKGKEITSAELHNEMNGFNAPNEQVRKAAEQQALNAILARKVLAAAAEKAGVDKTPEFALQKKRAEETLLVQTWQAQIAKTVPPASKEEIDKFVADNPNLYSARKVFAVDQIRFPRVGDPAIIAGFKDLKTIPDIAAYLAAHKIPYQQGQGQIDALAIGPQATDQIMKLPPTEVFIVPQGNLLVGNHITETRVVPVPPDAASKQAANYLKTRRTQEALQRQFGQILAGAKKDIVYAKAYQPVTPAKAGAAAVAKPAPTAGAPAAPTPAPKAP
jgi:EpsD family peptidyl-prolyl cis-trans isomerase